MLRLLRQRTCGILSATPQAAKISTASEAISKIAKASQTWQEVMDLFQVQPGSFDAAAYSNCMHQIPLKSGGYDAINDPGFSKLCQAAVLNLKKVPESWNFTLSARCAHGLALAFNPGMHIHMSPESPPPTAWRTPDDAAAELLNALWDHISQSPVLQSQWQQSATHMNAYAIASVGHVGPAANTPAAAAVWEKCHDAWLTSPHASAQHARGDDVARQVVASALIQSSCASLPVPTDAVLASLRATVQSNLPLNSSACASMLWGTAKLAQSGVLGNAHDAELRAFTTAVASNVKSIRHAIRPLDLGLISWGLKQLDAGAVDPLVFPLLLEQAQAPRMQGRLGGANAQLVAANLPVSDTTPRLGDNMAVRVVPMSTASAQQQQDEVKWPYGEKHTGVLGVVGV